MKIISEPKWLLIIFLLFTKFLISGTGKVYLVLGSDTAIWDGMSVGRYHCYYNIELYTNPTQNAYKVMDPAFRAQFVDSYGQPLKMTWWMMAGNIFRYANNKNVPVPNIMTLYLMKKYHGNTVQRNGDELSLHYHTFFWSDYNADGIWWWNQSLTFMECFDDFNYTLCQFLLEENIFPVSFRSGWHYMDNDWQHYLDELLPYSMHNDWPNVRVDGIEPLDNTYDWSQAPEEFVPYHPSPENYQIPGDGPGWDVRSTHFRRLRYHDLMEYIFDQANQGIDQVACIWGHLPETDFLENIEIIDSLAHKMANQYPNVKFRYCTAIEAMQRWQNSADTTAPELNIEEIQSGDEIFINIKTNEPIFQPSPFITVKDIYEDYFIVHCQSIGVNEWQTTEPLSRNQLAKIGVAVCDTIGNQSTGFINYLPDDIYLDNIDEGYVEVSGSWSTSNENSWGLDSRIAVLVQNDTVTVRWIPDIQKSCYYNIFTQIPEIDNAAENITFKIYANGECVDTVRFNNSLQPMDWVYIGTASFIEGGGNFLELEAYGRDQEGKVVAADVVRFSALVREYDLYVEDDLLNFGEVSQYDTVSLGLKLGNHGYKELIVSNISSANNIASTTVDLPVIIPKMSSIIIPIQFHSNTIGNITDTIFIESNDPIESKYPVLVKANVQLYFVIIDNEDSLYYIEEGSWHYSNAQAYGPTSRYSWLHEGPGANAAFSTTLNKNGVYEIFEIVPSTVNASNYAMYIVSISNVTVDSVAINQNEGSGYWVSLGRYNLPAAHRIEVKVIDTGKSTEGVVLRADAIKIALIEEITEVGFFADNFPTEFQLEQNFPNPFNSSTVIRYSLPKESKVRLKIFNTLGQEVATIVDEHQVSGTYSVQWSVSHLSSGVYLYQLKTDNDCKIKKLMIVK